MKNIKFFKTLSALLLVALIVTMTTWGLSGCDKQGFVCDECTNDTVYVYYQQEDSILNLLCNKWKLLAFVDDYYGTRKTPEVGTSDPNAYTLGFTNDDYHTFDGVSCTNSWFGQFMINSKTMTIYLYFDQVTNTSECNDDAKYYMDYLWKSRFFEVTSDSLRLYYLDYPFFSPYDHYFLYKKIQ